MSIKSDAIVIRDETVSGANTATRVGTNLVAIADDLIAKQTAIDLNTAKTSYTDASQVATNTSDIATIQGEQTTQDAAIALNTAKRTYPLVDETKLSGIAAGAEVNPDVVSQVEAEAGIATTERIWTAERVKQAIVALGGSGSVDDTAYGISWNGVTTVAPSKNALYDFIEAQVFKIDVNSNIIPVFWGGTQAEYDIDFPSGHPTNYFVVITDGAVTPLTASDITFTPNGSIAATNVQAAIQEVRDEAGGGLSATDIDTLAELNAIITDATLIDTTDARLSDARTPTAHTHTASEVTDFAASVSSNSAVAANTAKVGVTTEEENTIDSVVTGEPTGATNIQNIVWISQANYDAAVTAVQTVATTLYVING
jgi:hypothetical protein